MIQVANGSVSLAVRHDVFQDLVWTGGNPNNNWDNSTTPNWRNGVVASVFNTCDSVTFNSVGSTNPTVNLVGTLSPGNVTVDTSANDYALTGTGQIVGETGLTKNGTGTLFLSVANNTYSGGTTVNGGTLMVSNTAGSATGSGSVTVNVGGTLAGAGIISGAVTVNSGGALAPGNPLGTLTLGNTLTLAAGSTTYVLVRHSPLANDSVHVSGQLTEGGTLNVSDLGSGGFTAGDSFPLFSAGTYAGSFDDYVLPPLTGNFVWNTNTLKVSGTLSVVVLTSPTIASLTMSGGNLVISGTGGVDSWPYYLLASTNLASTSWMRVATNQFDSDGNFNLTNAVNSNWPHTFYRLQLQ